MFALICNALSNNEVIDNRVVTMIFNFPMKSVASIKSRLKKEMAKGRLVNSFLGTLF